jgi:hypothetical protein
MRKCILSLTTLTVSILWVADASAQFRRPQPGFFQPRPRPANARMTQLELPDAPAELDLHLSIAQIDGGMILGARYTRNITELIGVEGGFDHDHGNSRYGDKLLAYGDLRWKLVPGYGVNRAYVTAGVATGGGYSFALTPFVGMSGRGSCADPVCLRYDMTFFPAVDKLTERFRGSVGVSVSLR